MSGASCGGQSAVKVTEKENGWRRKKTQIRQKEGRRKKTQKGGSPTRMVRPFEPQYWSNPSIGHVGTRGVRPLRPSHSSRRPALWTISTSGKPLHAHTLTTSPLYRNMDGVPVCGGKQKKKVLLMVLRYCPGSTAQSARSICLSTYCCISRK